MRLFIYQGAALYPGSVPGQTVEREGVTWTVSESGHLEADVPDLDAPVVAEKTSASEQAAED